MIRPLPNSATLRTGLALTAVLSALFNAPLMAYEFTDLGPNLEPHAISDNLVVVGVSNTDQSPATAFFWDGGSITAILDGTAANTVNGDGQIAGSTVDGAFIASVDGSYRDWSGYGAFGNNAAGTVAGYAVGTNPYRPTSLPFNPAIFDGNRWKVWDIAQLYSRGTRKGVYADRFILNAINDNDLAVGYKYRYGLSGSSAILIDTNANINSASDVVYLPIPNGGSASAINNADHVVGTTGNNSSAGEYATAFLYDHASGNVTLLGTLPSDGPGSEPGISSYAYDINDADQVVGSSWLVTALTSLADPTKYHAFLSTEANGARVLLDLNDDPAVPSDWLLTRATAINNFGDIVGVGIVDGIEHGFLLTNGAVVEPPPGGGNQAPVAVISASDTAGRAPLTVTFDGSESADPENGPLIYAWDFGDGGSDSGVTVAHTFDTPGTYAVILTVTDDHNQQASDTVTIVTKKGGPK